MDKVKQKKFTASHLMLYIVLSVYIITSLAGLVLMRLCMIDERYEYITSIFVSDVSMISACSCTVVGFYANKAKRENELELSNAKYKMRLELAKDIYNSNGISLDDKSVQLLRLIISDRDIQIDNEIQAPQSLPTEMSASSIIDNNGFDEGAG